MPRIYLERREMEDELRRLFTRLEGQTQGPAPPGECHQPIDVVETAGAVEVIMDLPGVPRDQVHIAFARGTLLIAGVKRSSACGHADAAFHLAERAFGRFARAIRLSGALEAGRARATLVAGELRITIPRITERRGHEIRIAIESD